MYLKRIEVYGFKSFADRTELEFVPGVTAIVGPNGSGKSNVSDSIRWVLGEQSVKSLRGSRMEDVIFSGSDTRKAINYCEVTLCLDNLDGSLGLDYSEVTVTRRVYRSGESEFFLNKQACRLKDITELFMDTGLGKEAYSIIGQGRIEEILSTKAEDRRGIIEEAAGVVKYKSRKRDAVRKLEETEANLRRIEDIIFELEDQLPPLQEQAETAKRFKELQGQLATKEISAYVYLIETLHQQWQESKQLGQNLLQEEEHLLFQINEQDVVVEKLRWDIHQVDKALEEHQQRLLAVTEETERVEGQKEVLRERRRNFSTNKQEVLVKLQSLEERYQQVQDELLQEQEKEEQIRLEVERVQTSLQVEEQQSQPLIATVEEQLEEVKSEYIALLNQEASLKNELSYLEQTAEQYRQRLQKLHEGNKSFVQEREIVLRNLAVHKQKLADYLQEKESLTQQGIPVEEHCHKLTSSLEKNTEVFRNYKNQLEQISTRLRLLQELKEDFSGYFQGVKEVLKARDSILHGIDGAVAELIQVPSRYQLAIETALGAALQHIIVEDEQAGREAIAYLKQKRLGRATFLPRNVLKSRPISTTDEAKLPAEDGYVGLASQLITYEQRYSSVIGNLLGQVIVCTDIKSATQMAKQVQYRYRFVTLDGDIVNLGGSMTGGSVKQNNSTLLGREQEIERLEHELEKGKQALAEVEAKLAQDRDSLTVLEVEKEEIKQALLALQEQGQALRELLAQETFNRQRLDERLELYDQEETTYQQELAEVEQKQEQALQQMIELKSQYTALESQISLLEQAKKERAVSQEEKSEQLTQLKIELARRQQEFQGLQQAWQRLQQHKQEIEEEISSAKLQLAQVVAELDQQGQQEEQASSVLEEKKVEKDQVTAAMIELRQQRKHQQGQIDEIEAKSKVLRKHQREVAERLHQTEVKINRLDVELENNLTLLSEQYELSFELAKEQYTLQGSYDQVKEEITQLKKEIAQLGEVNLGAIDEYERVAERFSFLRHQEEDLQGAKHSLYEIIAEMDQVMSERFQQTFQAVRQHFQVVFEQLFEGGRADLILSDPEDMLQTGIEIMAQPPGKKLQNLALLSGGERALTALALLFAILKVKPVPFCVLDEVEAALDEANVSRFAYYLKEFSEETQFIVITHRKGTMEGADVLYGVTMQESGVSKIVSVKLEEKEEDTISA